MMEQLSMEMRTFVYTTICFQCLLQFTSGSTYHRYVKFFFTLVTLCMCCNIMLFLCGQIKTEVDLAQTQYDTWIQEWGKLEEIEELKELQELDIE